MLRFDNQCGGTHEVVVFIHTEQLVPILAFTKDGALMTLIEGEYIDILLFSYLWITSPPPSDGVGNERKSLLFGKSNQIFSTDLFEHMTHVLGKIASNFLCRLIKIQQFIVTGRSQA